MAKRKERVAAPPSKNGWDFRFATNDAVKGWDQICSAAAANAGGRIWYRIDDDRRTAWMTDASVGHPKATE
ncbi:MAG: hypothetical protein KUG57_08400 [Ilumatobacteraceae bacterium]|nr:hypothetical protein [Ilumatobacteraceae bacterium]